MTDWIDDFENRAEADSKREDAHNQALHGICEQLWELLLPMLRRDAAKINTQHPGYGVTFERLSDGARISKTEYPKLAYTVTCDPASKCLKIERERSERMGHSDPVKIERLDLISGMAGGLYIKQGDGEPVDVDPANLSALILRPMLACILGREDH
jgi:hypothetical protein